MGQYTEAEIMQAFDLYNEARVQAQDTNDWSVWADRFTEDAHYIEHAYGEFHGREAIREWICDVMAPFASMVFPRDWLAYDAEGDALVFQCQNLLPHPTDPDADPFSFPSWTRLVYGGNGLFKSEEDIYNPSRDAGDAIRGWLKAGGQFSSREKVKMKHSQKRQS